MKSDFGAFVRRVTGRQWWGLTVSVGLGGVLITLLFAGLAPRAAAAAGLGEPAASYPCSEAGLNAALAAGGSATFSCGAPTTVTVGARKVVSHNLSVDGTNTLILQGGTVTGVFSVPAGIHLSLLNFTLRDAGNGAILNNGVLNVSHAHFISNTGSTLFNQPGAAATISDASFAGGFNELGQIVNGDSSVTTTAALTLANVLAHDNLAIGGAALVNFNGPVTVLGSTFYSNLSYQGGAIYNESQLTVRDSHFNFNIASAAILDSQAQSLAPEPRLALPTGLTVNSGGAIFNSNHANLIVSGSFFTENFSTDGGGAIMFGDLPLTGPLTPTGASMAIDNSSFFDNCTGGPGGAVAASQATTVSGSTFTFNFGDSGASPCAGWASSRPSLAAQPSVRLSSVSAISVPVGLAGSGGALFSSYNVSVAGSSFLSNSSNITATGGGGALTNFFGGTLRVTGSLFQDNSALQDGGAIFNDVGTIATIGASTFTGNQAQNDSGGAVMNVGALTLTASLFRNNGGAPGAGNFGDGGGAIASRAPLVVQAGAQNSPAGNGPAAPAGFGPPNFLVVDHSTFISNGSAYEGGALDVAVATVVASTFQSNSARYGGAIDSLDNGLSISASTFIANAAVTTTNGSPRQGGAIDVNANVVSIQNSTFYQNHAEVNARGGAINQDGGTLFITNTTFLSNTADLAGTGGALYRGGVIHLHNTLLAFNTSENCSSAVSLDGANLEFPGITCGGASVQLSPFAQAPANNGGPTLTSALLFNSPAINAGSDSGCPSTDQRGAHRPVGAHCDIGAFEFGGLVPWLWLPLVSK